MAEFDKETREIVARLQAIRVKMLREQPFYAVLLMHLRFAIDESTPTAYTDGERIAFNPYFIKELDDFQLQFVLMHEILHVALGHCTAEEEGYDHRLFNIACDIVVNSNIMYSLGLIKKSSTFGKEGYEEIRKVILDGTEIFHQAPDGTEGVELTADEAYRQLLLAYPLSDGDDSDEENVNKNEEDGDGAKDGDGVDDRDSDDAGDGDGDGDGNGDGDGKGKGKGVGNESKSGNGNDGGYGQAFDDHSFWEGSYPSSEQQREENAIWKSRMIDATEIAEELNNVYVSVKEAHKGFGGPPLGVKRMLKKMLDAQTDWRTILDNFIQEEINDYSFSPPDRRFDDSPFFLPDFNEKETTVKNIVFLIDTSGSISDSMIQRAYSEIKGAIDQLGGKFEGYLAFCDHLVYDLQPFCEETNLSAIIPKGGGGNDFEGNIRFVLEELKDEPPECMIFITDGYDDFPEESVTQGIPFLWLITNTDVEPPWGKVARLTANDEVTFSVHKV